MKHLAALGLASLFVLVAACTGGSYTNQSYYSECESRGLASGSAGYSRCVSGLRGQEVIDYSYTRGKSYRSR